jgi:hypothetical protein
MTMQKTSASTETNPLPRGKWVARPAVVTQHSIAFGPLQIPVVAYWVGEVRFPSRDEPFVDVRYRERGDRTPSGFTLFRYAESYVTIQIDGELVYDSTQDVPFTP